MYDPVVGRWLSQDPIGFDAGDVNLYRYVGNHPTMATDPSGLDEKAAEKKEIVVIVTGFGRFGKLYPRDIDNPSNLLAVEFGNQVKALAKSSIARNELTCEVISPVRVDWDNIQGLIRQKTQEHKGKIIIWIAFGAADEFRIELTGDNLRTPATPDVSGRRAGVSPGVSKLNDPDGEMEYSIKISDADIKAIVDGLNKQKNRRTKQTIKIRTSEDAGDYICESTAYSLYQADEQGDIAVGLFIHTPMTLSASQRQFFAKKLIEQLIKHLNYHE